MLAGDFFENHEKYHRMFDVLENPQLFRQYNKVVIDRPSFQTQCNTKWEDVFGDLDPEVISGAVLEQSA